MHRFQSSAAFLLLLISSTAFAVTTSETHPASLDQRDRQIVRNLLRDTQFADVPHTSWQPSCEEVRPPEALATPDPLFTHVGRGERVRVSFIIGTDGHVHSPLILESGGFAGDRRVLQTVRSWKYRPATCNGIPTEAEGKIEFSIR